MYSTSDLKKGLLVTLDGDPHVVETTQASSPSARGGNTIHRVRFRNLRSGQRVDRNFRGGDMLEPADVDRHPVEYLYADTEAFHFMDNETYEQFAFQRGELEWESKFLIDGIQGLRAMYFEGTPIALELPTTVNLQIVETNPGVKGNSATGRTKPATLETGHVVQIPEHIDQAVKLTIDTRTGEFLSRAKD